MSTEEYRPTHPLVVFGMRGGNTFFSPDEGTGGETPGSGGETPEDKGQEQAPKQSEGERPIPERWEDMTPREQQLITMGANLAKYEQEQATKKAKEEQQAEEARKAQANGEDPVRQGVRELLQNTKMKGKKLDPSKITGKDLVEFINEHVPTLREIEEAIHHAVVVGAGLSKAQAAKAAKEATAGLIKHTVDSEADRFFAENPHLKPVEKTFRKMIETGVDPNDVMDLVMGLTPKRSEDDDDFEEDYDNPGSHRARARDYGFSEVPNSRRGGATSGQETTAKLVEATKAAIKKGDEAAVAKNVWRHLRQLKARR